MSVVRDLMTTDPVSLGADDDLAQLFDLMDDRRIRHVPVVDEDRMLVGLVSHRDLLRGVMVQLEDIPLTNRREFLRQMTVAQVMVQGIEHTEPDTDILEVAELMMEHKFGCVPVCEGERLVGILTETDFIRHVVRLES